MVRHTLGNSCSMRQQEKYFYALTPPAITCSKLTIKTLEQDVKYVQS